MNEFRNIEEVMNGSGMDAFTGEVFEMSTLACSADSGMPELTDTSDWFNW